MLRYRLFPLLLLPLLLAGCVGYPETVQPVGNFDLQRYLGTWYEVARLDHRFERGLSRVSADYTLNNDGTVRVRNRGFDAAAAQWQEAIGKARFVGDPDTAYLKVSFFGPFYGSYVVFELDPEYRYAFISGPDTSYLWLLSRTPTVDPAVYARFVELSAAAGFDTSALIRVAQP